MPRYSSGQKSVLFETGYGPWDYRYHKDKLERVERFHFTPNVENLIRGESTVHIEGDLNYLLEKSPNHHRGLVSLMRLVEKRKSPQPGRLRYPIECWFERAMRFAPDDAVVRVLWAQELKREGRDSDAIRQLDAAAAMAKDSANMQFSIGLVFFDLGQYDRALTQAHTAMALGLPRTELADRLRTKGQWRDPAPMQAAAPTTTAETAAPPAAGDTPSPESKP